MTQVVYRFEHGFYRCFKAACLRRDIAPNVVVAAAMARQMQEWGEPVTLVDSAQGEKGTTLKEGAV